MKTLGLVREMFYILNMVVVTQVYKFVKTYQNVRLKWVHFITYKLYINKADEKTSGPCI